MLSNRSINSNKMFKPNNSTQFVFVYINNNDIIVSEIFCFVQIINI